MSGQRLDQKLLELGLASTRSKAQELIRQGNVLVNGELERKSGRTITEDDKLFLSKSESPFVSRAGDKLNGFLEQIHLDFSGARVLDVGISTGGFSDCVLQRGAREVIGIDVGSGQLADKLRADSRVRLFENTDIRNAVHGEIGAPFEFILVDVSFISLELVAKSIVSLLDSKNGKLLLLVKPQYEVGRGNLTKKGIVRSKRELQLALDRIRNVFFGLGLKEVAFLPSTVLGSEGNQEFFFLLKMT